MITFDRLFAVARKPWVVLCFLGLLIFSMFYLDKPVAYYFHSVEFMQSLYWIRWLTRLGWVTMYLVIFLVLGLFFRYVYRNKTYEDRSWFLWFCIFIPNIICVVLKIILGRARPDQFFKYKLYGFYGYHTNTVYWSFPSGHTTTIMGLMFGLSILFPKHWFYWILTGLLVVFSRILLTYHYLSDVMAGTYLTLIEVGIILYVVRRKRLLRGCQL